MTADEIASIIEGAAARHGVPADALMAIANLESTGNINADNPRSSASGLFQFVDSTAREYGLTGNKRNDPTAQADAAAKMMATNARSLERTLGRPANAGELYLAHQQGLGGATALLRNPNRPAVDVLTDVYGSRERARQAVALNGGNLNQSAGQFSGQWVNKANQRASLIPPASIPNVVASQTDTQRPGIVGNSERPTSALSAAYPTQNATPRLAPQMDGIYAYNPDDMQKAQITPGLGSLTPDFFKRDVPMPRLDPRQPNRMDLAAGPASTPRAVTGFPTPLPGYQSGPQVRLPEISPPPGYNRIDSMAGMPSNAMRQELALQGQSYAGVDRAPSSGIGRPPATRTVPSVPVRPTQTAAVDGVGYMPTMGLMRATLGSTPKPSPAPTPTTAIPGPNSLPKGNEQLVAGIYPPEPVPSALPAVGTAIDVVPQVIPRVPIGPGLPPAPLPRPLRTGVNVQMPTPIEQRPTLPMPRPVTGFPTAFAQRPSPAPTLRVTVNGAGSYSGGGASGGSSPSQPQTIRGSATGREYNVGQQYQAGGYRFEAKPDGTFKNLGRV